MTGLGAFSTSGNLVINKFLSNDKRVSLQYSNRGD